MKKFVSLLLILLLTFAVMVPAALADNALLEADVEEVTTFDRTSPVTDWEGEWVLAAAVIGEDYADENDIDTTGLIAVPEGSVKMSVAALLDASASGSDAGVMVDQASYLHAHVYDMEATVTFAEDIADEEATLKLPWDGWLFTVRKLSKVGADDKSLYFTKVTGVASEEIDDENMKYVGMNEAGQLIVCYSDDNLVKKDGEVAFGYIFVRAE